MMVEKESGELDKNVFGSVWKVIRPYDSIKHVHLFPTDNTGNFGLTRYKANSVSNIRYKNNVTGSVQTDFPRLCYGGILADVGPFTAWTLSQMLDVLKPYVGHGPGQDTYCHITHCNFERLHWICREAFFIASNNSGCDTVIP